MVLIWLGCQCWVMNGMLRMIDVMSAVTKFILIYLYLKTQLTSDNKFFKCITSKGLSSKVEVLILWEF